VHTDSRAASLSSDLQARAFAIGNDVAFAAGEYKPGTLIGDALIAHELAHVVQQAGAEPSAAPMLKGGDNSSALEADADTSAIGAIAAVWGKTTASFADLRKTARPTLLSGLRLARCKKSADKKDAATPGDAGSVKDALGDAAVDAGPRNFAGSALSEGDKKIIQGNPSSGGVAPGAMGAVVQGAKFLLHDTSSPTSAAAIRHQATDVNRGPLGKGVTAYVPKSDPFTVARPSLFEARRPSTTEHEKAIELFAKPEDNKLSTEDKVKTWKQRRDAEFRKIWAATNAPEQTASLDRALAGQGLTTAEIEGERTGNKKQKKDQDFTPGIEAALGGTADVTTSASWAVEEICARLTPATVKATAVPGKEKDLTDTCGELANYFQERRARIASAVTVEIVQPGVKSKDGDQNTCNPDNPNIVPLDNPPYSDNQYQSIVALYLRAALVAGIFPEITTHFVEDAFIQGHCDPRCFDMGKLYSLIAAALSHPAGSSYGADPNYGKKWGTNNVWWVDKICHKPHP
jgi:hypothetical protein